MGRARQRGTLEYFKCNTWGNIQKRTVNGSNPHPKNKSYLDNGIRLEMTKEAFYSFCDRNKRKILAFYRKGQTPSIDRLNDAGHYHIDNIQIISFEDNRKKANSKPENLLKRVIKATLAKLKPCLLILPNGRKETYPSIKAAALAHGLRPSGLSKVLRKERKAYKNFKIKYLKKA